MGNRKDKWITRTPNWLFVKLVNIKGKARIQNLNGEWVIEKDGITLTSPTPKFIGFGQHHFENKIEQILKIEPGDTAIDVGAAIGDTTIPMIEKVGKKGYVIAVEPDPTNAEYLTKNLTKYSNWANWKIIRKAAWNQQETLTLNLSRAPTGHSLIPHPERPEAIEVETDTLQNITGNKTINFVKIDVQGAEVEVVEGIGDADIRKLVVETHSPTLRDRVAQLLKEKGYEYKITPDRVVHAWRNTK